MTGILDNGINIQNAFGGAGINTTSAVPGAQPLPGQGSGAAITATAQPPGAGIAAPGTVNPPQNNQSGGNTTTPQGGNGQQQGGPRQLYNQSLASKITDYVFYGIRPGLQGSGYLSISPHGQYNPQTRQRELTDRQLRRIITRLVLTKGYTDLYCYRGNMIDQATTGRVNIMLMQMSREDRTHGHLFRGVRVNFMPSHDVLPMHLTAAFTNATLPFRNVWRDTKMAWTMKKGNFLDRLVVNHFSPA